jgi:hypothetical protein
MKAGFQRIRLCNEAVLALIVCVILIALLSGQGSISYTLGSPLLRRGPILCEGVFYEGLMVLPSKDGHGYCYADANGADVFHRSFRFCLPFHEGVAVVWEGGGWRFFGRDGRYLSEPCHLQIKEQTISEGLMPVELSYPDKWGYVDRTGQVVIKPAYCDAGSFHEGLAPVCQNGKWGYIDKSSLAQLEFKYDGARSFSAGVAVVKFGAKWGCIDRSGKWVVPPEFDELRDCREGAIAAKKDGKWGAIDPRGNIVIPVTYEEIGDFSEGLIRVKSKGKWGFLDRAGRTAIAFGYVDAEDFREGAASVAIQPVAYRNAIPLRGYISHSGEYIVEPQYYAARSFSEGLATVIELSSPKRVWIIDRNGTKVKEVREKWGSPETKRGASPIGDKKPAP